LELVSRSNRLTNSSFFLDPATAYRRRLAR
jgi:hypothetical protein